MAGIFFTIGAICGLVSLVCFILVLIRMFQAGDTVLGIVCIVTIFCGIGGLIAFVMGWVNAAKYSAQQVMLVWTAAFIGGVVFNVMGRLLTN